MRIWYVSIITFLFYIVLVAQPSTITYQGKLLNNLNLPITQIGLPITFAIYDSESGGTKLWPSGTAASKSVDVVQGLYSVLLGTGTGNDDAFAAGVFAGFSPWLEVVVDGNTLPRTPLTNVPFSLLASQLADEGWASPGEIGSTTPNIGNFTELTVGTSPDTYSFPTEDGTNGQVLVNNGAGELEWIDNASVPTGFMISSSSSSAPTGFTYTGLNTNLDSLAWTAKTSMPTARRQLGVAVAGYPKKIYAIGGYDGSHLTTNEEYNPVTNTWSTRASMTNPRRGFGCVENNGMIYAVMGFDGTSLGTAEVYNPTTNTWSLLATNPAQLSSFAAAEFDNKIYCLGGSNGGDGTFSSIASRGYVYTIGSDTWDTLHIPFYGFSYFWFNGGSAVVYEDEIYFFSATFHDPLLIHQYNPITKEANDYTKLPTLTRYAGFAIVGDKLFCIGGESSSSGVPAMQAPINKTQIFDFQSQTWFTGPDIPVATWGCGVATIRNKIYIVGGFDGTDYINNLQELNIGKSQTHYFHMKN